MKKILFLAIVAILAFGCSKENTGSGNGYPELYPLIDVPAKKLAADIDYKISLEDYYSAKTNNYSVTALGRTVAITPQEKDVTTARLMDIQKDMESHYKNKGLIKTRIVETKNRTVALDF